MVIALTLAKCPNRLALLEKNSPYPLRPTSHLTLVGHPTFTGSHLGGPP